MEIRPQTYRMHIPYNKKALEKLIYEDKADLADIDTSHIRDMSDLFSAEVHDPDDIRQVNNPSGIRRWNTANTFNFHNMFRGAKFADSKLDCPTWRHTLMIDFHNWDMRNALFIDGMFDSIEGWKPFGINNWILPKVMDASSFMSNPNISEVIWRMHLPESCRGQNMLTCHPEVVPHYVDTQPEVFRLSYLVDEMSNEIENIKEEAVSADDLAEFRSIDWDSLSALTEYDLSGIDNLCNATCDLDYRDIRKAFEDIAYNGTAGERLDELERRLDTLEEKFDKVEDTVSKISDMIDESEDMADPGEINEMVMAFRSIRAILKGERHD